ncbi:MAG: hypothetical protein QM692_01795, partial [Thermomicrobiales bacterium]
MRVIIAAPRKSGSAQLRCLLAMAYGLKAPVSDAPSQATPESVQTWLDESADNSVATCDFAAPLLADAARAAGVSVVAVIRHPYDLFLSNYEVAQQRASRNRDEPETAGAWAQLAGLDLTSTEVEEYARVSFGEELRWLRDWAD